MSVFFFLAPLPRLTTVTEDSKRLPQDNIIGER